MLESYTSNKPIDVAQFKQNVLNQVKHSVRLTPNQMKYLETGRVSKFDTDVIQNRATSTSRKTGLAIAFNDGLQKQQEPSAVFKQLLAA